MQTKTARADRQKTGWQAWMRQRFVRQKQGEAAKARTVRDFLPEINPSIRQEAEAQAAVERLLQMVLRETGAEAGQVWLRDEATQELTLRWGMEDSPASETEREADAKAAAQAAASGETLILTPGQPSPLSGASEVYMGAAACWTPLREPGAEAASVFGLLTLKSRKPGFRYTEERRQTALACAEAMGLMLASFHRYEGLRATFLQGLVQIVDALERRHPSSQGHSQRVAGLCVTIARRLGVAPDVVETLRIGALLHDLAKLLLPESLLFKPDQLTLEEFAAIRQYPAMGYSLGRSLDLSDDVLMLLRNHHERLDGAGYPDNLKQGELPLPLRILCVADAFDAMSSSRSHRGQMTGQLRREQLNRFAGTQFDPVVIESLKSLLDSGELNAIYQDVWEPALEIFSMPMDGRLAA